METYQVGDTILLISSIPKVQRDRSGGGEMIDYSGSFALGSNIFLRRLDSVSRRDSGGRYDFTIAPLVGRMTELDFERENGINVYYSEQAAYELKIAFVPIRAGSYLLSFPDPVSRSLGNRNCTNAAFEMTITNPDKHFNVYQMALGRAFDMREARYVYCFRVVQ
ncbi:hypothetical protein [Flaviaesturariibacter terrae]